MMQLSKSELEKKLTKMRNIAQNKREYGAYYYRAKNFLMDLDNFKKVLDEIEDNKRLNIIREHYTYYKQKEKFNILFDTSSILLLQSEGELYLYLIAEYKLRW